MDYGLYSVEACGPFLMVRHLGNPLLGVWISGGELRLFRTALGFRAANLTILFIPDNPGTHRPLPQELSHASSPRPEALL